MASNGQKKLHRGIYAAMATPLTKEREVDHDGLSNIINFFFDSGINGLSILGTTGEINGLRRPQRLEVLKATLEIANGRGTIFTGAAGTVASDVLADIKDHDLDGVSGVLVPPPFYYPLNTVGVVNYYTQLADESPLGIILYNIPQVTKVPITPEAVEQLGGHPNIIGIKDSSGDFANFTAYTTVGSKFEGFTMLTGGDPMLAASLMVGGHGLIGGGTNAVPALEAQLFKAFNEGDMDTAVDLQRKIAKAVVTCKVGVGPTGYKAPHVLRGHCQPYMTHPLPWLTDAEMEGVRDGLKAIGQLD